MKLSLMSCLCKNIQVKLIEPVAFKADFGGRSMDFFVDESLTDYKAYLDIITQKFQGMTDEENE